MTRHEIETEVGKPRATRPRQRALPSAPNRIGREWVTAVTKKIRERRAYPIVSQKLTSFSAVVFS
eukprot:scaffold1565_cov221-Amphora_coffeaeformis.AAC.8